MFGQTIMVLEGLGRSLRNIIERITGSTNVSERLVKDVVRDLQRVLLQSDVNVQSVLEFTRRIEDRANNEKPAAGRSIKDHIVGIIYDELIDLIDNGEGLKFRPQTIMIVGLYGQGKTTTAGKLALLFSKKGFSVGLIAGDVHRPAAYDQLRQLGEKINVEVYGKPEERDAAKIVEDGIEHFRGKKVVIIDTSGRHSLEVDLIQELKNIDKVANPQEKILVLDSQIGQQAGPQAETFHNAIGITGVILTKMDGTAKGGGAISAVSKTHSRIVCIGTGEHIRDLEPFDASKFISRLLGMGDLTSLANLAKEEIGENQEVLDSGKAIMSGKFTLSDMYHQLEAMNKVGPLEKIVSFIPGMSRIGEKINYEESQERLRTSKYIIDSMTEEEKNDPTIIRASRARRIAIGSGTDIHKVRELIKQYNNSKKAVKSMMGDRKTRKQFMKQMGMMDLSNLER
ncbi:MAG: signal recognition particle protein Srp54 [archaeon]|nr:signal recognition particle protein Srp54 [archaeon]